MRILRHFSVPAGRYQLRFAAQDSGNPDEFWFYELYTDADALKTHGGSPAMKEAGGRLAGLVAGRPELIMLTPTTGTGIQL